MTKVPKFRAWDKTHDKLGLIDGDIMSGMFQSLKIFDESDDDFQESEKFCIMQSTGIKDKNGAEIYESDIVFACDYDDEQGADVYEVCYLEESLEWVLRRIVKEKEFHLSIIGWDELEVIGNVYENKELLE